MDNSPNKNTADGIDIEPVDFESLDLILEQIKQFQNTPDWEMLWEAVATFCIEVGEKFELAQEEKNVLESMSRIRPVSQKVTLAFDQFFEKIKLMGDSHWSPYADLIAAFGLEFLGNKEQKQKLVAFLQNAPLCDPICRRFALNGLQCDLPTFASAFFATAFSKNKVLSDFAKANPAEIPEMFQNFLVDAQTDGSEAHIKFMENVIMKIDMHRLSMVIGPIVEMNEIEFEKRDNLIAHLKSKIETVKTEEFYKFVDLMRQFGETCILNIRVARRRIIQILENIEPKGFLFLGVKKKDKKDEIIAEVDGFFDWLNKTVQDIITSLDEQVAQLEQGLQQEGKSQSAPQKVDLIPDEFHPRESAQIAEKGTGIPIDCIKEFFEAVFGSIQKNTSAEEILADIILFASDLRINLKEYGLDVPEIQAKTFEPKSESVQDSLEFDRLKQTISELEERIKIIKTDFELGVIEFKNEMNSICESVNKTDTEVEKILKSNKVDKSIRTEAGSPLLRLFGAVKTNTDRMGKKFDKLVEEIDAKKIS